MNACTIRDLHDELNENERLSVYFDPKCLDCIIIKPTDKVSYCDGDLIVENIVSKQIIAPDKIIRVCKRRNSEWD